MPGPVPPPDAKLPRADGSYWLDGLIEVGMPFRVEGDVLVLGPFEPARPTHVPTFGWDGPVCLEGVADCDFLGLVRFLADPADLGPAPIRNGGRTARSRLRRTQMVVVPGGTSAIRAEVEAHAHRALILAEAARYEAN